MRLWILKLKPFYSITSVMLLKQNITQTTMQSNIARGFIQTYWAKFLQHQMIKLLLGHQRCCLAYE